MAEQRIAPGRRRPGGRTSKTRQAVMHAALEELAEHGYRDLSVESVALRSGVHRTTLYRRWGSAQAVLAEAATVAMDDAVPIPNTGTLHGDLLELARLISQNLQAPVTQALIRLVAAEGDRQPWLREASANFWRHRANLTSAVVDRAVARGELPADADAGSLLETLIAPLYLRLLVTGQPLDASAARTAADLAMLAGQHLWVVDSLNRLEPAK